MKKAFIIFSIVYLFFGCFTQAQINSDTINYGKLHQDNGIRFEKLSVSDGLSQNSVETIIQDHYGFMWFGTEDGLNRFDGYEFQIFKKKRNNSTSLSNNTVNIIYEDKSRNLWVGTDKGLNLFNYQTESFKRYTIIPEQEVNFEDFPIHCISEHPKGVLWIGTEGNGMYKFDIKNQEFTHFKHHPDYASTIAHDYVYAIRPDNKGNLWIGTEAGLSSYSIEKNTIQRYPELGNMPIISLLKDDGDILWLGYWRNGLKKFNTRNGQVKHYLPEQDKNSLSNNIVRTILKDSKGYLWLGTRGGGLNKFNPETEQFLAYKHDPSDPSSISNNFIWGLYESDHGIMWIGTRMGGLNKFDQNRKKFHYYKRIPGEPNSLSNSSVMAVYEDSLSQLWVGTRGGGLDLINRKTNEFTHYSKKNNNFPVNIVFAIKPAADNSLWVGADGGGLTRFYPRDNHLKRYEKIPDKNSISNDNVYDIEQSNDTTLWIGTWGGNWGGGLDKLNLHTGRFTNYALLPQGKSPSMNVVMELYYSSKNMLWLGTQGGGLNKLNPETEEFTYYKNKKNDSLSLSTDYVYALTEDSKNRLWVGTAGGGLNLFHPENETFTTYNSTHGLNNNIINGLLEDNSGNIWMSTNNGISKFDPENKTFRNYSKKDGLQGNVFNQGACFKNKQGEMFFGGIEGLTYFFPDSIKDNPYSPNIKITKLKILNKEVEIGKEYSGRVVLDRSILLSDTVELSYKDYLLTLEFSALHYAIPSQNKYKYKLENFDKEWIETTADRRFATYSNLPGGTYTFKVKASNCDGIWNENPATLTLVVHPPFYETNWFKILIIIFLLLSTIALSAVRNKRIMRQKNELEQQVKERTAKVEEQKTVLSLQAENLKNTNTRLEEQQEEIQQQSEELSSQAESLQQANKELQKLSIVARETDNAIILINKHGKIEWINQGFEKLYGYSPESIINGEVEISQIKPDFEKLIKVSLKTAQTNSFNSQVTTSQKKSIWVQTTITPILSETRRVEKLIAIDSDITKIKAAEEEISQQKEEIEAQRDELQKVNTTKDKFFSIIAHDLKNPMNALIGFTDILVNDYDELAETERKEFIEMVHESSVNLHNLLINLLQWARTQTGSIKFEPHEMDLHAVIDENVKLLTGNAEKKEINLKSEVPVGTIAYFNPNMVNTILRNIVSNAIKFTDSGGNITITAREKGDFIHISVTDTGVGIEEENIKKLFKLDEYHSTKGTFEETGTGLGLIICEEFVKKHRGEIYVNSEVGVGTTFTFSLPQSKEILLNKMDK